MTLGLLKQYGLVYLATPYTKYHRGLQMAYVEAAVLTAALAKQGIAIYRPIVHTHPLAKYGNLDPLDHEFWMEFDYPMTRKSDALLVARMLGWHKSSGVQREIALFEAAGKPIHHIHPVSLRLVE